jgi:hypothetical protein
MEKSTIVANILGIHSVQMLKHHEELNLCLSRTSLVADGFSAQASLIRMYVYM